MEQITYLVANYNCSKYLKACLTSLKEQTSSRWDCLICDDASTNDSLVVITPYLQHNTRLLRNEKNLGYTATLKRLIEEAKTDIVGVLDADDALFENATEELMKVYDENEKAEFVYSRFRVFDESLKIAGKQSGGAIPEHSTSLRTGFISHLKTFRKSAYGRTEGLDLTMDFAQDRDLVCRLEEVTRLIFIDKTLYKLRQTPGSESRDSKKREAGLLNHIRAKNNAVAQRRIGGLNKAVYKIFIRLSYVTMSHGHGSLTKKLARFLTHCLYGIDRGLRLRSNGQLRRR